MSDGDKESGNGRDLIPTYLSIIFPFKGWILQKIDIL